MPMAGESRGSGRAESSDFIRGIVARHQAEGTYGGRVETRFPPEPNGFLHIGHTRAIVLNFGLAAENGGACHLRFDDTNPCKEEEEYVDSIIEDIRWLGFDWGENLFYASDYFGRLYGYAVELIKMGKAYVCDLTAEDFRISSETLRCQADAAESGSLRGGQQQLRQGHRADAGQYVVMACEGRPRLPANVPGRPHGLVMRDGVVAGVVEEVRPLVDLGGPAAVLASWRLRQIATLGGAGENDRRFFHAPDVARTRDAIAALGLNTLEVDVSEFRKMDGGLTCLSLRFETP